MIMNRQSTLSKILLLLAGLMLVPLQAHAHAAGAAVNGWHDGFNHPLHGWDHLIVMIAVGLWAAQQRGRAVWLIPLTFVGVMTLGGIVGVTGIIVPGVELAILVSVAVFSVLVARRIHFRVGPTILLVGFFAFFHGFAHGAEMPGSASMVTFGLGFILATLLLHGLGLVTARLVAMILACLLGTSAVAQQATNTPAPAPAPEPTNSNPTQLPEVVVQGRQDSMIGIASSATQGTTGAEQLADRPILRSGEIMETVPGVIITQHAGGGKANQYFLRGFNLDHGTDFATYLDGMPLNLPSHAHGEGYSDMNVVIPELVERLDYEKGPYYAEVGNYGSAGAAHLVFYKTLPQDFVTVEGGMFGYERAAFGLSQKVGPGNVLVGGEAYHDDGPWVHPDDYSKFNGLLTYSQGDDANGFSVTGRAYHGKWNSSDQLAENAVALVGYLGTLNPTDGGNSERYSLQAEWHRADQNSETKIMAYGFYYDLDLFSDFTYYLTDTTRGDQFEQQDRRWVGGVDARQTFFNQWFGGRDVENTFGLQVRNDWINNGLYQTVDRVRVEKLDSATATFLPATTEADYFTDTDAGLYAENKIQWSDKFRSVLALRGDLDYFDVTSRITAANSGTSATLLPEPKLSLIFGPWAKTEFYAQGGFGFHSNDGRGATQTFEPVSAANPSPGTTDTKIRGLIQTKGAEIGVRTLAVPHWQSTLSLWYLYSDSELQQDGDTGGTIPSKEPDYRYGVEWANYYAPIKHLAFDLDLAESAARFTRADTNDAAPINPGSTTVGPGGTRVPEAVGTVISSGITLHDWKGFSASLRLRYFGPRDLTSDGNYHSDATMLLNAEAGYQINKTWRIFAEFLNLLDSRNHDIDYAYTSRITPTATPAFTDVFHPVEPFQVRVGVTARF
jgi:hydrogenase/urease accessory protein HupE/outer membrane cobalamin receptor